MANNPLYPGYIPTPKDENVLYPGYYPGTPMERNPRISNTRFAGGLHKDFNFAELGISFDEAYYGSTLGGGSLPGWVKDRIIDDFEQSLKASIRPSSVDPETLDDFSSEDLPGAMGISLSLNPVEWAKDPGKTLKNTLNSWRKSVIDWPWQWSDLDNRVRENLWNQVISDNPDFVQVVGSENLPGSRGPASAPMAEMAARQILRRTGRMGKQTMDFTGDNPLALRSRETPTPGQLPKNMRTYIWDDDATYVVKNPDGSETTTRGKWVLPDRVVSDPTIETALNQVGKSVVEFERSAQSPLFRDGNYDTFQKNVINAIAVEIQNDAEAQRIISENQVLDKSYKIFRKKKRLIDGMGDVKDRYEKVTDGISQRLLGQGTDGELVDLIGNTDGTSGLLGLINNEIDNLDSQILGAVNTGVSGIDLKEGERLRRTLTPYRGHLEQVKKKMEHLRDNFATMSKSERRDALRQLNVLAAGGFIGKGATGGDVLVESFQRELMRSVTDDLARARPTGIGVVINGVNSELQAPAGGGTRRQLKVTRLRAYTSRLSYERDSFAIDELFSQIESGKFLETYLWKRIKRNFSTIMPSEISTRILKKLNYMGLIISNDKGGLDEKGDFLCNTDKRLGKIGEAPDHIIGNWWDAKNRRFLKNDDGTDSGIEINFSMKMWGGSHFSGAGGLIELSKLVDNGLMTEAAFHYMMANIGSDGFNNPDFMRQLVLLNGGRAISLPAGVTPDKFAKQIMDLREWVNKHAAKLKLKGIDTTQTGFWKSLVDSLRERSIAKGVVNIAKKYSGLLEKLWQGLNLLQAKIIKRFGKYFAPFAYVKTIIVEAASEFIIKLLDGLAAGATGGVGAIVVEAMGRIIRPLVRFVVRKAVELGELLVKGLLKGDIGLIFASMEKSMLKYLKFMITLTAFPLGFLLLLSTKLNGDVLTTYSPVDPSAKESAVFDGDGTTRWSGPDGDLVTNSGIAATASCFEFTDETGTASNGWPVIPWNDVNTDDGKLALYRGLFEDLGDVGGCYVDNLCRSAGTIEIWNATPDTDTYCGQVSWGLSSRGNPRIVFSDVCNSMPHNYLLYLITHETGHVWDVVGGGRPVFEDDDGNVLNWSNAESREGPMPTYPLTEPACNGNPIPAESWAELIGNWVVLNLWDCGCGVAGTESWCDVTDPGATREAFWERYPMHKAYADELFTSCATNVSPGDDPDPTIE